MPIVLNTNAAATEATFNLSKSNDNLRRSIARLSSGNRITKPTDDAGGLAVAYKLQSTMSRTEAALNNHQNALSYLQVQDGVLDAMGAIVDRMAELRTLAADVSKNSSDVENYSKEFVELQDQLNQMKREKFNGVELFSSEEEWDNMQGINKNHLIINGAAYEKGAASIGTKAMYEYFDHPDASKRTNGQYDKYEFELYTHPSGQAKDGSINLNVVNLQFMLGLKDPGGFGVDQSQTGIGQKLISSIDTNGDGLITGTEWNASGNDTGAGANNGNSVIDADEISTFEAANNGWGLSLKTEAEQSGLDSDGDGIISDPELVAAGYDLDDGFGGVDAAKRSAAIVATGLDSNNDGSLDSNIVGAEFSSAPGLYTYGAGNTISIANTVNLAGLNQPTLDPGDGSVHISNNGTNYSSWLNEDGYIKDIEKISIEEFTNIIEKIADARAENGAEQARIGHSVSLHQNNLVNLQAAHGRIMDVDVAMESTRLARHSVNVQAGAAMVAQANQMTAIALTLLSQ
jgi:flagellin-like hook-associated protein FlgL